MHSFNFLQCALSFSLSTGAEVTLVHALFSISLHSSTAYGVSDVLKGADSLALATITPSQQLALAKQAVYAPKPKWHPPWKLMRVRWSCDLHVTLVKGHVTCMCL